MSLNSKLILKATITTSQALSGLKKINDQARKTGTEASKELDKINKTAKKAPPNFRSFTDSVLKLYLAFQSLKTAAKYTVGLASDLDEVNNALSVIASKSGSDAVVGINKFIDAQVKLGAQSELQTKSTLANFLRVLDASGLARQDAFEYSKTLTKLGVDIASFYNISNELATTKLIAGILGEIEPLRQLGIVLTDVNIRQTALEEGIISTNREMTEQEKIAARYVSILKQTQAAQGDFERTQDELANSIRITQSAFISLGTSLGSFLVPIANELSLTVRKIAVSLNDFVKTSENASNISSFLVSSFSAITDIFTGLSVVISAIVRAFTSLISSFQGVSDESSNLRKQVYSVVGVIESLIDAISFLVNTGITILRSFLITVTGIMEAIGKALILDFKGVNEAGKNISKEFAFAGKKISDDFANIWKLDAKIAEKNASESISKVENSIKDRLKKMNENIEKEAVQSSEVQFNPELEVKETSKTSTSFSKGSKKSSREIVSDLKELQTIQAKIETGSYQASVQLLGYYGQYEEIQAKLLDGSSELTENEKKALDIFKETTPLLEKNLSINGAMVEYEQNKLSYAKELREYYENELKLLKDQEVSYKNVKKSIEDIPQLNKEVSYWTGIIDKGLETGNEKLVKSGELNLEIYSSLLNQLEAQEELGKAYQKQLDFIDKTASALSAMETFVNPAIDSVNTLLDSVSSGISGDITGSVQGAISSISSGLSVAFGPIAGVVGGAINGIISSITNLILAVQKAKTREIVNGYKSAMEDIEYEAKLLSNEIEASLEKLEITRDIIDQNQKVRDLERLELQKELIDLGYSELEIEEKLAEFDKKATEQRINDLEKEKNKLSQTLKELESKTGLKLFDDSGLLSEDALTKLNDEEKRINNTISSLEKKLSEIKRKQEDASDKDKDLYDREIAQLEYLLSVEKDKLQNFSDEQKEIIEDLLDLDISISEEELKLAKEKLEAEKKAEEEKLKLAEERKKIELDILQQQYDYIAYLKGQLGGARSLEFQTMNQAILGGNQPTGLLESQNIGVQVINNSVNQSYY